MRNCLALLTAASAASSKLCLSDYLPDYLLIQSNYDRYFSPLSEEDFPIITYDEHVEPFLFLPHVRGEPDSLNRELFIELSGEVQEILFYGFKDSSGNDIIIDRPNKCAVSVNDHKTFIGFPKFKAWFALPQDKLPDAEGTLFLPGREPGRFLLSEGLESHLQSLNGQADLSDLIESTRVSFFGCTAFFAHQGGTAVFSNSSATHIFTFRDVLKGFDLDALRSRSDLTGPQLTLLAIADHLDKLEIVEAWEGMRSLNMHNQLIGYESSYDPYITRYLNRLVKDILSGNGLDEVLALST